MVRIGWCCKTDYNAISDLSLNERRLIMFLSPLVRKAVDIEPNKKTFLVSAKRFCQRIQH